MDAVFATGRGGEREVLITKEKAGRGVMVLVTGASAVLEGKRC